MSDPIEPRIIVLPGGASDEPPPFLSTGNYRNDLQIQFDEFLVRWRRLQLEFVVSNQLVRAIRLTGNLGYTFEKSDATRPDGRKAIGRVVIYGRDFDTYGIVRETVVIKTPRWSAGPRRDFQFYTLRFPCLIPGCLAPRDQRASLCRYHLDECPAVHLLRRYVVQRFNDLVWFRQRVREHIHRDTFDWNDAYHESGLERERMALDREDEDLKDRIVRLSEAAAFGSETVESLRQQCSLMGYDMIPLAKRTLEAGTRLLDLSEPGKEVSK